MYKNFEVQWYFDRPSEFWPPNRGVHWTPLAATTYPRLPLCHI